MLYVCDFREDPERCGWTWTPSDNPGGLRFVASEGWYPDKGGTLTSPRIAANSDPLAFYRLRFRSRTEQQGYWAVQFQSASGINQVDDAYAAIHRSSAWMDNEVVVRNRDAAATLTVMFQGQAPISVSALTVEVINAAEAAASADRLYATLPALAWTPPAKRWERLPRTQARLRSGGELRIVQLGDSIVNDTNNGNWDVLVGRLYPSSKLRLVTSVRGSTGCWHYREPEHFAAYVAAHHPDLLLIGGISNQRKDDDVDQAVAAVREVAHRALNQLGCEVALLTGPMGTDWRSHNPATPDAPLPQQTPPPVLPFYHELAGLADSLGLAVIDCHSVWHRYLAGSCKPWQWFHRDAIHANDRGKQIIARMMERWFADSH